MKVTARACSNIALVKYWGKRDEALNLPAGPSLSMTVAGLVTTTTVSFESDLEEDQVLFEGSPADLQFARRVGNFLDVVRDKAGTKTRARVETGNDFPAAAGLASSASGFAALAVAAARAAGLDLPIGELAGLARMGSGSAPRSLMGGYVEVVPGEARDGSDFDINQVAPEDHWDLRLVVALVSGRGKSVSSRLGMNLTAQTSPYHPRFVECSSKDVTEAIQAIRARDLERLGRVVERSCLRMHADAMAADPGLVYFRGTTVEVLHAVRGARKEGLPAYFTLDAGPNPMVICEPQHTKELKELLAAVQGVQSISEHRVGPGPSVDARE